MERRAASRMTLRRAIALAGAALLCFSGVVGVAGANPTPAAAAAFVQKPCTDWKSQISPPDTIRVLRTNSGVVEEIPFKLYVYRTHVAEFYTEYKSSPYSDALLGVGAIAIKQNAWSWTMKAKDWFYASTLRSATYEQWLRDDLADDGKVNGTKGRTGSTNSQRATENFKTLVPLRIRYGADLLDDGIGGLVRDYAKGHVTAPIAVYNESGGITPVSSLPADTPRSCFDVTDEPSINQIYRTGGIYDPGWTSGSRSNARYNAAVDATWGTTVQRLKDDGKWYFANPGFYGSWNGGGGSTTGCLVPPKAGQTGIPLRHATQPGHWRGVSIFVMNADTCAKEKDLSVEELIRYVWYTVDANATGETSYSKPGSRAYKYRINWVESNRIISPGIDVTGDGKGDFTAIGADGSIKFISSDKYVGTNGRLRNRVPGTVPALAGATLLDRDIARTERDGGLSVLSLWRAANGATSLIKTPISSGVLGTSVTILDAYTGFDATATLSLDVADTSADIIQEFFITERTPDLIDATAARLRLFEVRVDASPVQLIETTTSTDAVTVLRDVTGDGVPDATVLWRATDGALMASQAAGTISFTPNTHWSLGTLSTPGALLWPIASGWSVTAADALSDTGSELYLSYRDLKGIGHIVRLAMSEVLDIAAPPVVSPDLVFTPETAPVQYTTVRAGESRLAKVAARLGYKSGTAAYAKFLALNAGPTRLETIRSGDTYAKIAARVGRTEGCLRSMNPKSSTVAYPAKVLIKGQTVKVPVDTTCVYTAKSVMYRNAPVRILAGEVDWLRASDTWEIIAARAAAIGVTVDAAGLATLNPTIDLTTATAGTEVRIRAPWAAVVRSNVPATTFAVGARTYAWGSPLEVWKATASGSVPKLMARDWTGDGILDLFFTSVSSTGSVTLQRLGYTSGRLVQKEKILRTSVGKGWTLQ
ncbi:MAG: LysM peptidoglycan-binding domain-containing protein [Candidatus Aquidulcis sp.]|nr:MAG: LysM peptidoglycan-binding domain-containing protein [Candidatus Aquidulcis sp.]RLT58332.1 MAG: LysM peptidoglycan-binding domain-containing protein [Candidatus Aquidulcis sp.]